MLKFTKNFGGPRPSYKMLLKKARKKILLNKAVEELEIVELNTT